MTADHLQKQSPGLDGHLFRKGRSGNPAGRRPGCRNLSAGGEGTCTRGDQQGAAVEIRGISPVQAAASPSQLREH
jgi:hypothetical protein